MLRRALAVLAVVPLVACSPAVGPLGESEGHAHSCVPLPGSAPVVSGDEALENHGMTEVTVYSVRLVEPRGLTLRQALLLPIVNTTLIGTTSTPEKTQTWSQRVPAEGATVGAGESRDLALLLDRTAKGSFADIEVTYEAHHKRYVRRLAYSLEVLAGGPCGQ